jgi:Secretion system C-terminal sorting domain
MRKSYFNIAVLTLFSLGANAQEDKQTSVNAQSLETLNVYPNPVGSTGRIFVNSKTNFPKEIEIFDVLGKSVLLTTIANKELNIASLLPGVYIIQISEGIQRATRKLIIK